MITMETARQLAAAKPVPDELETLYNLLSSFHRDDLEEMRRIKQREGKYTDAKILANAIRRQL